MSKTTKKATKTARKAKTPKVPYKVIIGRVSKDGKKYLFADKDKHAFSSKTAALEAAHQALNADGDGVREVLIVVNPEAQEAKA